MSLRAWIAVCVLWVGVDLGNPQAWAESSASSKELAPEVLLLARAKYHMAQIFAHQPDYVCVETVVRSRRQAPARRYQHMDTVRLEVALVGGKEMFSWPGSRQFEVSDLRELLPTGTVSHGEFALHARAVFLSPYVQYRYAGEEPRDGRLLVRYDYWVPLMGSGYRVRVGEAEATVAYYGSFWVDRSSLDLVRLDVIATEIPPHLGLLAVRNSIEYRRMKIGTGEFLLPSRAVVWVEDFVGNESRNEIEFHDCRQYVGESVISFEPPPEPVEGHTTDQRPEARAERTLRLPPGVSVELRLETELDSERAAIGDLIQATVVSPVRYKGAVILPKGAVVEGRLIQIHKLRWRGNYFAVLLQLESIEVPPYRGPFEAVLEYIPAFVGFGGRLVTDPGEIRWLDLQMPEFASYRNRPGFAAFYVKSERLRLPVGTRMIWRSQPKDSLQWGVQ